MTRTQLYDRITQCVPAGYRYEIGQAVEEIWGQPFDGVTEKITEKDEGEDCVVVTKPMIPKKLWQKKWQRICVKLASKLLRWPNTQLASSQEVGGIR